MKYQNFIMRILCLLLILAAVVGYNSMQKKDTQAQESQEITALTKRVEKLEEQNTEILSALEEAAKNQEAAIAQAQRDAKDKDDAAKEDAEEADTEEAEATTEEAEETAAPLEDGVYTAEFDTDSGMFHVNEANDGKGVLTVENGKMTIHVSLASKKIVNLYPGLAEDAQKDGAELLEPTTDTVTYSDGESEEVYGFDIPVPALDKEFDVALIGEKGTWYDHKVSVTNPVKAE